MALALLARGRAVLMLDGGKVLEPNAVARRDALAAKGGLSEADREAWRQGQYDGPPGQIRRYGSDFAMEPGLDVLADVRGFDLRSSKAVGGLSNLWGAAVLPYAQQDIADWPVSAEALAPHYRAVAGIMPVSGRADDLERVFAAFSMEGAREIAPSLQGAALLARLERARAGLVAGGVYVGAARHAVSQCRRCGLCLQGCPYGFIWSAGQVLPKLTAMGMGHRAGVVLRLEEQADGVAVMLAGGEVLVGARVFVAAGVLETARIMLSSGPAGRELMLLDSQQAFLPMLHRWGAGGPVNQPPFHTLPQAFVEMDDKAVSPHLVHAQIYSWNEYYLRDLMANYAKKLPGSGFIWAAMARRLMVAQVFLHSAHSARIGLRMAADGRLVTRIEPRGETHGVMMAAVAKLAGAMGRGGLIPLRFAARLGAAGASFHTGGTVPMAAVPGIGTSDRLGRPYGMERVHLVDASVFPSIPATTITFSVMANAHRIGTEAG